MHYCSTDQFRIAIRAWCRFAIGFGLVFLMGCHGGETAHEVMKVPIDLPPVAVDMVQVTACDWPKTVRAQGSLVADEVSVIGAKVAGRVASTDVDLGTVVKKGDPLTMLEITDFELRVRQTEAQLAEACAKLGLKSQQPTDLIDPEQIPSVMVARAIWQEAKEALDRVVRLQKSNTVSQSEFDKQLSAERVAGAQYESALRGVDEQVALIDVRRAELAMARQALDDAVVRAPFDGVVQERHIAEGVIVQQGTPLVTLVRTDPLRFRGQVPELKSLAVRRGQPMRVYIEGVPEPLESVVRRTSPTLNEFSRSLQIEADIDNSLGIYRSGVFAEADIVVEPAETALAIPASAVGQFAGVYKVWLVTDGVASQHQVEVGRRALDQAEIVVGLSPGQWVVAEYDEGNEGRVETTMPEQLSRVMTQDKSMGSE